MMVGFISDTHGSALAWTRAIEHGLGSCDLVIHCGDVLYHGPRNPLPAGYDPQALTRLINGSALRILFARGNCDAPIDQLMLDYPLSHPAVVTEVDGVGILAHHGDVLSDQDVARFAAASAIRVVVSGHTHTRVLESEGGIVRVNPGSCSLPKTDDGRPSFGLFDGNTVRLLDIMDGTTLAEVAI